MLSFQSFALTLEVSWNQAAWSASCSVGHPLGALWNSVAQDLPRTLLRVVALARLHLAQLEIGPSETNMDWGTPSVGRPTPGLQAPSKGWAETALGSLGLASAYGSTLRSEQAEGTLLGLLMRLLPSPAAKLLQWSLPKLIRRLPQPHWC